MATGVIDYASLKTEIANFTHRTDLTAELDTIIQMAEAVLNRKLRCRQMDISTTLTATGRSVALPADFLEVRNVDINGSPITPLKFLSSEQIELYDRQSSTGKPRSYGIVTSNLILSPTPDQSYVVDLEYYQKLPTLVNGVNTNNWLILGWPDAYLYGALLASVAFTRDDSGVAMWSQAYNAVIEDINRQDSDAQYSGDVMRLRTDCGW